MAAIDATLANLLGNDDIVLASRNVYGGTYQLLHDWYGKRSNLNAAVEWFDGEDADAFAARLSEVEDKFKERIAKGRQVFIYLESPCNPHGYVLDVPGICRIPHATRLTLTSHTTIP